MPILKETIKRERTESGVVRSVTKSYLVKVDVNQDVFGPQGGLPRYGDALLVSNSSYQSFTNPQLRCTRLSNMKFVTRDTTAAQPFDVYECDAVFTDDFLPLLDGPQTWTYSRKEIRVPFFRRYDRFYPLPLSGPGSTFTPPTGCPASSIPGHGYRQEWISDPLTIYVPYAIQTRVVWVDRLKFNAAARRAIRAEIGKLHRFAERQDDEKAEFGVFEPPRVVEESNRWTRIEFGWAFDPGNGPFQQDANTCRRFIAPNIFRPPFYAYRVIPAANLQDPPEIEVYSTIPGPPQGQPTNPYYNPDGWKQLVGLRDLDGLPV